MLKRISYWKNLALLKAIQTGDRIRGERIVCQYRNERNAILIHMTSGHKGMQRVIEHLPTEAIVDKV